MMYLHVLCISYFYKISLNQGDRQGACIFAGNLLQTNIFASKIEEFHCSVLDNCTISTIVTCDIYSTI